MVHPCLVSCQCLITLALMTLGPAQTPQRNVSLGSLYSSISTQQCCNSMSSCPSDHNKEVDLERRMKVDPPLVYHRNIQTWLAFVSGHFLVSSAIFTVRSADSALLLLVKKKTLKTSFACDNTALPCVLVLVHLFSHNISHLAEIGFWLCMMLILFARR